MLQVCRACTTAYSVGAPACPECRSTDYFEEGHPMPKISKAHGATHGAVDPERAVAPEAVTEPDPEGQAPEGQDDQGHAEKPEGQIPEGQDDQGHAEKSEGHDQTKASGKAPSTSVPTRRVRTKN